MRIMNHGNERKLLVIGNGFDLAHDMKTRYTDFSKFIGEKPMFFLEKNEEMEKVLESSSLFFSSDLSKDKTYKDILKKTERWMTKLIKDKMVKPFSSNEWSKILADRGFDEAEIYNVKWLGLSNDDKVKELKENISDYKYFLLRYAWFFCKSNYFVYFFKIRNKKNGLWVDFENDIEILVRILERESRADVETNNIIESINIFLKTVNPGLKDKTEFKTIKAIREFLLEELNIFIDLFEFYLMLVDVLPKKKIKFFKENKFDYILSFNYTGTYKRLYPALIREDVCYIHGRAGEKNIVLGVDETLTDANDIQDDLKEVNNNLGCIRFKKYFQRLYKKTGAMYKEWFNEKNTRDGNPIREVVFFGHSLDVPDRDILREIIIAKTVDIIKIYYFNEETYAQQLTHLVKVIGKGNLLEYTGSGKIEFINQTDII